MTKVDLANIFIAVADLNSGKVPDELFSGRIVIFQIDYTSHGISYAMPGSVMFIEKLGGLNVPMPGFWKVVSHRIEFRREEFTQALSLSPREYEKLRPSLMLYTNLCMV